MDWEKFFEDHGHYNLSSFFYEVDRVFTVEELYQAFKARLEAEQNVSNGDSDK